MNTIIRDIMKERAWRYESAQLVGSRKTCTPPPMDTDIDILIFTYDKDGFAAKALAEPNPFKTGNEETTDGDAIGPSRFESDFVSLKRDDINLIITDDIEFHQRFVAATSIAKRLNLRNKPDRIALFQAILYGRMDETSMAD